MPDYAMPTYVMEALQKLRIERRDTEHYEYPRLCRFQDPSEVGEFLKTISKPSTHVPLNNCIYIHVPFCTTKCSFCNYFKVIDNTGEATELYVSSLVREIEAYGATLHADKRAIKGIHFGGGTPSVLSLRHFQAIFSALHRYFDMSNCPVISLEATLKSLADGGKIEEIAEAGFNRVSFGVQTLNPEIRRRIGVRYEKPDLDRVCGTLRQFGLENYNVDLMYNLPDQDPGEAVGDIDTLFELGVNNIDLYFLNVYPKTNIEKMMKRSDSWANYNEAERQLAFGAAIYEKITDDPSINLIFSNTISRRSAEVQCTLSNALGNNRMHGGNQISFGPSARGVIDGYSYKNAGSLEDYFERVGSAGVGFAYGRQMSDKEARERILVMFPNFTRVPTANVPTDETSQEKIDFLSNCGVLERSEGQLRVKPMFCFFSGNLSAYFQSKEERQRSLKSYFLTRQHRLNFYNQDTTNIARPALVQIETASAP